jgi:hypothetical protein
MSVIYMTFLKEILKYKHIIAISIAAIAIASYVAPINQLFPFAKAQVHQTSAQSCITGAYGGSCQNLNSQNAGNDIVSNVIGIQSPSTTTLFDSIAPTSPQPVSENTQGATPSTSQPSSTNEADGGHSTDSTSEKDTNTNTNTNTNSGEKDTRSSSSSNSGEKDTHSSSSSSSNSGEKDTHSSSSSSSSNSGEKDTKSNRSQGEKDT